MIFHKKFFPKSHFFYLIIFLCIFIVTFFLPYTQVSADSSKQPDITAGAAIVVEFDTGKVLFEKNADKELFPESITKMITGILAIENIDDPKEIIKISDNSAGRNNSFFT